MKWIGGIFVALVLWGVLQGSQDVDLSEGKDTLISAAGKIISGAADTTVMLLPKIIDGVSGLVDQIPDNGNYEPPSLGGQ